MVYVNVPVFGSIFAHCGTGFWYGDRGDFISDEGNRLKLCKFLAVYHKMHRIPTKVFLFVQNWYTDARGVGTHIWK